MEFVPCHNFIVIRLLLTSEASKCLAHLIESMAFVVTSRLTAGA